MNTIKTEQLAKVLGYAGLIPFVVFSIGTWIDLPGVQNADFVLRTYGAIILSFMGAIHWGAAMSHQGKPAQVQLALSVFPALFGWAALLIAHTYSYSILIIAFVTLCVMDQRAAKDNLVPAWYVPMRIVLTTVVVLSLIAAALA
ncbi:DUF3429 domain-containing protein [Thiohalophilus sp.]|uniref:DUF3429 domain-containing protein n=1 Tax=Thiohalophilus sp. TaxID=3028392 RepID=UPI002ACD6635|nr:DUF3429 domain-containing protein [Thiohalophilus sp.]MDZ7802557.1 DUF3429 domain-containing protein [Thiohalophilus sp.]